jgi:hypothetical protein
MTRHRPSDNELGALCYGNGQGDIEPQPPGDGQGQGNVRIEEVARPGCGRSRHLAGDNEKARVLAVTEAMTATEGMPRILLNS